MFEKTGLRRAAWFAALAAVWVLACDAPLAFAVRAERGAANEVRRTPSKSSPARERSADQTAAATEADRAGIRVSWDDEQGSPRRVRGGGIDSQAKLSSGVSSKISAGASDEGRAHAAFAGVGRLFGFRDVGKEFRSRSSRTDELGFKHVRMAQLHEGLRVVGGELIAHFDADENAYEVNGRYVTGLDSLGVARLTPEDAVLVAKGDQRHLGQNSAKTIRKPELVVFAIGQAPALAFELFMRSYSPDPAGVWVYWIDAGNGEILLRYNDLRTIAPPTANGVLAAISGNMLAGEGGGVTNVTGWHENGGNYYLHNTQRWWQVYNVASGGYTDKNTYANRSSNNWWASDLAEISLAHAFEKVQGYYFNMFGLRSFDNAGKMTRANVHQGNNYVNAYWDSTTQALYFGDGDGVKADSLAVLDIAGHEFGHAVAEYTAKFVYANESGALDESFADISGTSIEFLSEPDGRSAYSTYPYHMAGRADWLIGEDCWLSSPALRDMRSPANTATVGAGNEQPSRYGGSHWYSGTLDNGGVHYNSGVQNFFFYLLAEGGSGVNDGISYSVTGIGVSNAARVAYRTVTAYCTSATDYRSVRDAWMSAAEDLNPTWVAAVDSAWNAVGLGSMGIVSARGMSAVGPAGGPFTPLARTYTLTNSGVVSLTWTATHTKTWLDVTPSGGILFGGKTTNVLVALNGSANGLAKGNYSDSVVFSNAASGGKTSLGVTLRVGNRDDVTELFDTNDNDLNGYMLTFKPDNVTTTYTVMAEQVSTYPTDPTGGTLLSLGDDTSALVTLPAGKTVCLFGVGTNCFYVGSNGYITFGNSDTRFKETFTDHFSLPRISVLFDDLDPSVSGSHVTWTSCVDRVAVTYDNVPQRQSNMPNRMQVEMFFDGTIRIAYPELHIQRTTINVNCGLVGLSRGAGLPIGFVESDLNGCGAPPLLLVTPPSIDFGVVQVGTSNEATFAVTNAGEWALQGAAVVVGAFSVVTGASYCLAPGTAQMVRVRYGPASEGVHSNDVTFSGGGGASRAVIGRAIGNGDKDGDGATDWEEYLAGTSATNGLDYFQLRESLAKAGGLVIRWDSITGRWYTVSANTNLAAKWTDVYTASGTGVEMSYTNPPSGSPTDFLRVRVQKTP